MFVLTQGLPLQAALGEPPLNLVHVNKWLRGFVLEWPLGLQFFQAEIPRGGGEWKGQRQQC